MLERAVVRPDRFVYRIQTATRRRPRGILLHQWGRFPAPLAPLGLFRRHPSDSLTYAA